MAKRRVQLDAAPDVGFPRVDRRFATVPAINLRADVDAIGAFLDESAAHTEVFLGEDDADLEVVLALETVAEQDGWALPTAVRAAS